MNGVYAEDIDKLIIDLRKQLLNKSEEINLLHKQPIGNEILEFSYQDMWGGIFKIMLPTIFEKMDEALAALKFFSKNRPEVIVSNPDGSLCITFSLLDEVRNDLGSIMGDGKSILLNMDDKIVFYEDGIIETKVVSIVWFEYKSSAGNEKIYNMMFLFTAARKIIMGTFHCLFEDYDQWKPVLHQMLRTVQIKEDE